MEMLDLTQDTATKVAAPRDPLARESLSLREALARATKRAGPSQDVQAFHEAKER